MLANVYLHYVFDLWIEAWRKKVARGDVIVVRRGQRCRVPLARLDRLVDRWIPVPPCFASLSYGALRRQSSKVEAVCVSRTRTVCAGGVG